MNIVIADDSLMFRSALSSSLSEIDGFNVIAKFSDGKKLLEYFEKGGKADIVILDLEMPVLDGLGALSEIRKINKVVKIIMFSSATVKGAEKTISALAKGANDFISKMENSNGLQDSLNQITKELVPKIKALCSKTSAGEQKFTDKSSPVKMNNTHNNSKLHKKYDLVFIGSSTGGPDALIKIFEKLSRVPHFPMVIVQHMPPMFTTKLAATLSMRVPFLVKEVEDGELIKPGICYVAPGDYHLRFKYREGFYKAVLDKSEKVCHVRPSVDVCLESLADCFVGNMATFILTGMGSDGANGVCSLDQGRSSIYIQDKESSVVWGMPGAVYKKNVGAKILSIDEIGPLINRL